MKGRQTQTIEVGEPFYGLIDLAAEPGDDIHVEVQDELGIPGSKKLYVHVNGQTILRICKIKSNGKNALRIT